MKKAIFLLCVVMTLLGVKLGQDGENVYIRGDRAGVNVDTLVTPDAALEIDSDDNGLLIPRLTTLQRDAILAPANGLMIYNTDCLLFNYFNGIDWVPFPEIAGLYVGPISGAATICEGATDVPYSIPEVPEATEYTWSLPDGATISSGESSSSIEMDFGSSAGRICVTAHTPCGSQSDCMNVEVFASPVGGTVTGSGTITYGESTGTLILSGHSGTVDRWQRRLDGGTWIDLSHTGTIYSEIPSSVGIWDYRAVISVPGCGEEPSGYATVTVEAETGDSLVFSFNGAQQTWVVPVGIANIRIKAWGAAGNINSGYGNNSGAGGLGGYTEGDLSVTPGETVYIYVGGINGWNGGATGGAGTASDGAPGGNGGGASDVRYGGTSLAERKIVAGGGGGGGGNSSVNTLIGGAGGHGAYPTSFTGATGATTSHHAGGGGTGGTQVSGGTGGDGYSGDGVSGSLGLGGAGNDGAGTWGGGGGGGGGGYYGGGGGGGGYGGSGGGGGGGSSYIGGVTSASTSSGVRTGNGRVVIAW